MLAVTIPILANAPTGTASPITIDPSQGQWTDQNNSALSVSATPGSVTVGGSLSIQNVVPGGALLAAGTLVQINGTGFSTATTVSIAGVSVANTQFIGPSEIDVTLGGAGDLTGKQVVVANPDGSQVEFYSSISSVPDQAPVNFAGLQPLLSMQTWTAATTFFPGSGDTGPGGIALQNPNPVPVDVILQTLSLEGGAQTTITIPPGALQVYFTDAPGALAAAGNGVNAFATLPLRMLGIGFVTEGPQPSLLIVPEPMAPAVPPLQQVTASPTAVSFSWQVGTAVPAPVTVYLEEPLAVDLQYSYAATVTWSGAPFSISYPSTSLSGALSVAVNPVGLSPGIYTGSITITPVGAQCSSHHHPPLLDGQRGGAADGELHQLEPAASEVRPAPLGREQRKSDPVHRNHKQRLQPRIGCR